MTESKDSSSTSFCLRRAFFVSSATLIVWFISKARTPAYTPVYYISLTETNVSDGADGDFIMRHHRPTQSQ